MKKFLSILAVAGVMTACNNSSEETTTVDSTTLKDSTTVVVPVIDSTNVDSSKIKSDSAK